MRPASINNLIKLRRSGSIRWIAVAKSANSMNKAQKCSGFPPNG